MESIERRYFGVWQGGESDAVPAPQAFADAAQSEKDQVELICKAFDISTLFSIWLGCLFHSGFVKILA